MIKAIALLIYLLGQAPGPVAPLNQVGVATACDNQTIPCTFTDPAVPPGPHFYFVVAASGTQYSGASNRVDVVVPAGTHNVVLNWTPSTTSNVTYFVYRGAPATNLKITGSN